MKGGKRQNLHTIEGNRKKIILHRIKQNSSKLQG
jgi:hypothetical protein